MQENLWLFSKSMLLSQNTRLKKTNFLFNKKCDRAQSYIAKLRLVPPKKTHAIALVVNSPGGSPSQSDIICDQTLTFCRKHKIPLYTFAEDLAVSGGYFILCIGLIISFFLSKFSQGDKIFVDNVSLVGSIGAITMRVGLNSFLTEKKIERRKISSNEFDF